jgi:hypothetical protein
MSSIENTNELKINPGTVYSQEQLNSFYDKRIENLSLSKFKIPEIFPVCENLCLSDMDFDNKDFVVPHFVDKLIINRPINLKGHKIIPNNITYIMFWNVDETFGTDFSRIKELVINGCDLTLSQKDILSSSIIYFSSDENDDRFRKQSKINMTDKTREFLEICSDEEKRRLFLKSIEERKKVSTFRLMLEKNLKLEGKENIARNRVEILV